MLSAPLRILNGTQSSEMGLSSLRRHDGRASRSPVNVKSTDLYNIVNGQVAPTQVNIQDAFHIGITQSEKFAALLPDVFHSKIERNVETMKEMKKVVVVNVRPYLTLRPYSAACWSSVNNVAWR